MIRFFLFYFLIIHLRAIRMMVRPPLNGDTNWCSSPLLTVNRLVSHPILGTDWQAIDVGCGEGLMGLFLRLIKKKPVILIDNQPFFLRVISVFCWVFRIKHVQVSSTVTIKYPSNGVFFCVWSSWSCANRNHIINHLSHRAPSGAVLVSVGHQLIHSDWIQHDKISETFAWGKSTVYYYKHA